jgi:hypothetical protein
MGFTIPFYRVDGFKPKTSIPDNETTDAPVEFQLSMAAGADHARLKSLLSSTAGLASSLSQWSPEIQRSVTEGLRASSELFVNTVGRISGLYAPAVLCLEVGFEIMRLTAKSAVDDRFFGSRSASQASGAKPSGSATPAQNASAANATAGSRA